MKNRVPFENLQTILYVVTKVQFLILSVDEKKKTHRFNEMKKF